MALAAGKETGKTGNSGQNPTSTKNVLETHITEGLGTRRSRKESPPEGGTYCQQTSPETFTHLPAAAADPSKHGHYALGEAAEFVPSSSSSLG